MYANDAPAVPNQSRVCDASIVSSSKVETEKTANVARGQKSLEKCYLPCKHWSDEPKWETRSENNLTLSMRWFPFIIIASTCIEDDNTWSWRSF